MVRYLGIGVFEWRPLAFVRICFEVYKALKDVIQEGRCIVISTRNLTAKVARGQR
jgi:hypothetical protein